MVRLVLCNCCPQEARSLAQTLVEEDVAACVNIIDGVTSIYRWDGELCDDTEATLLIKTTADGYDPLCEAIKRHHSYEVPEIICLDPEDVDRSYAEWVHDQVR